jgi:[amino group carrier protein]-lysine/ornithine hydrolase
MSQSKAETLIGLVSQYSPSGQERAAADWLVARMQALGYDEAYIDEAGNPVGKIGRGPKQVVLLGHIDTVPGEIPVRVDGDILYGRGSVDAKGPLACFTDAVAQAGAIAGWQFVVIGAVEEERDSEGALYAVKKYLPDYAIVGEPNRWDRIALGYKGSAWANIIVKREQAHSASGEQTACEAAVELWLAIRSYAESFNADKKRAFDKILPTLRGMDSGADAFEQWARLNVGVRLPVDVPPIDWYKKLVEIAGNENIERLGYAVPAWACEKNTPLVRAFLSAIRGKAGTPSFVFKTGTSDLNIVAPVWKCPALVYGPGDSALDHTPDEHISLDEYLKAVDVLREALKNLAG